MNQYRSTLVGASRGIRSGMSDGELGDAIRSELERIYGAPASQSIFTANIRRWVSALVPISMSDELILDHLDRYALLSELLAELRLRRGAFKCGGTNDTLARVYGLFGLPAVTLLVGAPKRGLSHIVTLVQVSQGGADRVLLQDAYFNYGLSDGDGPIDYFQVYSRLRMGDVRQLHRSRLRTWKTEIFPPTRQGEVLRRKLRAWYWDDPAWTEWLQEIGRPDMLHVFGFPAAAYCQADEGFWKEVCHRLGLSSAAPEHESRIGVD